MGGTVVRYGYEGVVESCPVRECVVEVAGRFGVRDLPRRLGTIYGRGREIPNYQLANPESAVGAGGGPWRCAAFEALDGGGAKIRYLRGIRVSRNHFCRWCRSSHFSAGGRSVIELLIPIRGTGKRAATWRVQEAFALLGLL